MGMGRGGGTVRSPRGKSREDSATARGGGSELKRTSFWETHEGDGARVSNCSPKDENRTCHDMITDGLCETVAEVFSCRRAMSPSQNVGTKSEKIISC